MACKYAVCSTQYAEGANAGTPGRRSLALPTAYCPLPTPRRRGFTFTEVMFAVILLGIGFIMLAGMFPVAIQQTAQTQQETVGASLALTAVKQISQHATMDNMFWTGQELDATVSPQFDYIAPRVLQFRELFVPGQGNAWSVQRSIESNGANETPANPLNPLWKTVRGDMIFSEDPRFAFVPFYQRVPGHNVAKLIVIVVQSQNFGTYEFSRDVVAPDEFMNKKIPIDETSPYATLEPRKLEAFLSDGGPDVDIIELKTPKRKPQPEGTDAVECADTGAFVVISDDGVTIDPGWIPGDDVGRANGRIYRLGARRPDLDGTNLNGGRAWELAPGYDMASRLENIPLPDRITPFPQSPSDPAANEWYTKTEYDDHSTNVPALVYVIGRGQEDPTNKKSPYVGNVQDVAAYTTYINLK